MIVMISGMCLSFGVTSFWRREHRGAAGGGLGTETIMIVLQWYTVWRSRSGDGVESTSLFSFEN